MNPKVSVVMPTYNQRAYIAEAIASVLAQTSADLELVVVDDGSTDGTRSVVEPFLDDARVLYVRQENMGTGEALNTGFDLCGGAYETWWASDNVMRPDCIAVLGAVLDADHSVSFVYSHCDILAGGTTKPLMAEVGDQTWSPKRFAESYMLGVCWLWRRHLRLRAGPWFQAEPCEDYEMALRMAISDPAGFKHVPATLGTFRRHPENMSQKIKGTPMDYGKQPRITALRKELRRNAHS